MNQELNTSRLDLEFVNGPLDGHCVSLCSSTDWGLEDNGPLSCPWHEELGAPQAQFFPRMSQGQTVWCVEAFPALHQTFLLRLGLGVPHLLSEITTLRVGDVVMANEIFLRVNRIQ